MPKLMVIARWVPINGIIVMKEKEYEAIKLIEWSNPNK